MFQYLVKQAAASVLVLLVVVTITFFLIGLAPGGLGLLADPNMDPEVRANIQRNLGLDQPLYMQYLNWMSNILQGDLGRSFTFNRPVLDMILERLSATLLLGAAALLITVVVGFSAGVIAARFPNSLLDQVLSFISFVLLATPGFWLGILLIIVFAVLLGWLPAAGMQTVGKSFDIADRLSYLVMPAIVLAAGTTAELMRYTRSSWLEIMNLDYIRTARSKGLAERVVHNKHVLRNALIPILTIFGLFLPRLIGGAAVTETLFAWPGMGSMAVAAAVARDTPLVLGITIFISTAVILSNLLIDVLYSIIDPRIRY
ncbi:ABC transporter permease [uncultured Meiothermus sp.]|uniref:ABC transporter permease n=1 Tax=uncultured Meiothermus sp. TaxID=157471 RepID=UPI0026194B4A|nr:ABC transporter permease [uncultured Meiothermus sp.]